MRKLFHALGIALAIGAIILLNATETEAQDAPVAPLGLSISITAADQQSWTQVAPVLDQCLGAAMVRHDTAACAAMEGFLSAFADKVAHAAPVKPDAPVASPDAK